MVKAYGQGHAWHLSLWGSHPPLCVALRDYFNTSPPPPRPSERPSLCPQGLGREGLWDPSWTSVLLHGQTLVRGQKDMDVVPAGGSFLICGEAFQKWGEGRLRQSWAAALEPR